MGRDFREGEKITQVWQEGKSRVQVGMGSSDRACLCRYPESSPKSRHEKAVGVSAAESWHFSGAGESKGWLAQDKSGPCEKKRKSRCS